MNSSEFIHILLEKKIIDKDIYKLSLSVEDIPMCNSILNAIDGSDEVNKILNPNKFGEVDLARGDLILHCLQNHKNDLVKKQGIKFINELAEASKLNLRFKEISEESNFKKEYILGIDLGTTNSVIGFVENERAETIVNSNGSRLTPSTVCINKKNNKFDVGKYAENQKIKNPTETFYSIKRFIGRRSKDLSKTFLNQYPFKTLDKNDRIYLYSEHLQKEFTCEEISAQVLIKLKTDAERFLNSKIKKCVIAVPAYFDNNQRKATKTAAKIAGLEVIRIIEEPTAAALAYSINKVEKNSNILVFDLGGGTFDISMVRSSGENLDSFCVIAKKGDRNLGGDDYSNLLIKHILKLIKKQEPDVLLDIKTKALVKNEVNRVKHALSDRISEEINIPFLPLKKGSVNSHFSFEYELTREEFQDVTKRVNKQIEKLIGNFLNLDTVKNNPFTKVVAVGGASRMPFFLNIVEKMTKTKPVIDFNPDEIVALGASYYGEFYDKKMLIETNPLSLGVGLIYDEYSKIIPNDALLPSRKIRNYTTSINKQKSVVFPVYQGECNIASKNIRLGEIHLKNILIAAKGVPHFDVIFELNREGILLVKALDKDTKSETTIKIENTLDLEPEEIQKMITDAFKYNSEAQEIEEYWSLNSWLKIFDEIIANNNEDNLTNEDILVIDQCKKCLNNKKDYSYKPEELIKKLRIIIKKISKLPDDYEDLKKKIA